MPKTLPKNLSFHDPVLRTVAVDWLSVGPGKRYVDATLGGGGHSREILRRGGHVLGLDQDPEALAACPDLDGLVKVQTNFSHLAEVVEQYHFRPVAGVLFDLGMSQHQVQTGLRGFSWQKEGPLDMRMGTSAVTAADVVNQFPVAQLASLLKDFGEIPVAKSLAAKIIAARPLTTTGQLVRLTGKWSQQAFQALRIAVNDELGALKLALPTALEVLERGGRLVVISFHSLEDRLVKRQFLWWEKAGLGQILTRKPVSGERGAKLRALAKSAL